MILSFLFVLAREICTPTVCCHCQQSGDFLCSNCYEQIIFSWQNQHYLSHGSNQPQLSSVYTLGAFSGPIKSMVIKLKYQGVRELAAIIAHLMYHTMVLPQVDIIVPVPAHQNRLQQRGFNQAQLIAGQLALLTQTQCVGLLARTKSLTPQAQTPDKSERQVRQQHSMDLNQKGKKFFNTTSISSALVVDDVFTTGATLLEAARALQSQLPTLQVFGLTVARA